MAGADCVFCKIVAGQLPSIKLAESRQALAIMDINPFAPGHALVIAKGHYPDLYSTPAASVAAVASLAKRVARAVRDATMPDGINIVQANGPGAAQSVLHYHVHVLPRHKGDNAKLNWPLSPGDREAIIDMAARIKGHL